MEGGKRIFVVSLPSLVPSHRQTDGRTDDLYNLSPMAYGVLQKRTKIPSFPAPGNVCVNSVERG